MPPTDLQRRLQIAVGARLQQARKRRGYRQRMLAERLRLSRTSISNIERGAQRIFIDQIYDAAVVFRVDPRELLPPLEEISTPPEVNIGDTHHVTSSAMESARNIARTIHEEIQKHSPGRTNKK